MNYPCLPHQLPFLNQVQVFQSRAFSSSTLQTFKGQSHLRPSHTTIAYPCYLKCLHSCHRSTWQFCEKLSGEITCSSLSLVGKLTNVFRQSLKSQNMIWCSPELSNYFLILNAERDLQNKPEVLTSKILYRSKRRNENKYLNLYFIVIDFVNDIMRRFSIHSTAHWLGCSKNLLHCALQFTSHWPWSHCSCNLNYLVHGQIAIVFNCWWDKICHS